MHAETGLPEQDQRQQNIGWIDRNVKRNVPAGVAGNGVEPYTYGLQGTVRPSRATKKETP